MDINSILQKAQLEHSLTKEELVLLLNLKGEEAKPLFAAADAVRRKYVGDDVHLRGLIEFSNCCHQNCCYCGLRRDNAEVKRYRLEPEEIIDLARKAKGYGYKTVVLQSGEDNYYTVDKMVTIIKAIHSLDIALTLSIGEKTFEEYKAYKDAGANRYLLRIETTDKEVYEKLDPDMSHENRIRCIKDLKTLGYEVGSGSLVGLPGQSIESLADDVLFFKSIPLDMAGIGPFIPNPETPLADVSGNNFELALKVMALTRLVLPDINIPATTAMETLDKNGRIIALQSGANVVMPNVTEGEARKLYKLYPGKICTGETPSMCRGCIEGKITSIGRTIGAGKGFHGEYLKNKTSK